MRLGKQKTKGAREGGEEKEEEERTDPGGLKDRVNYIFQNDCSNYKADLLDCDLSRESLLNPKQKGGRKVCSSFSCPSSSI